MFASEVCLCNDLTSRAIHTASLFIPYGLQRPVCLFMKRLEVDVSLSDGKLFMVK